MSTRARSEDVALELGSIDGEHRLQTSLVGALGELVRRGGDPEMIARTMAQLVDFTSVHFLSEELMMRLYSYPAYESHSLEHGRLTGQVKVLQERLQGGERAASLEVLDELRRWLGEHIQGMDQAFASWCQKSGAAP